MINKKENNKLLVLKRGEELGNDSTIFITKLILGGL